MLNGNSGDAKFIIDNFEDLSILGGFLKFEVEYRGQKGTLNIVLNGKKIKDVILELEGFQRPLGSHNDEHLYGLAQKLLNSLHQ